jgi:hypothetical protein
LPTSIHLGPGGRGIDGPIRAAVDVTVEPVTDSRSRLTIAVDFDGHGRGKVLVPLVVRREAHEEMPANLAALKRRLEGGQPFAAGARARQGSSATTTAARS